MGNFLLSVDWHAMFTPKHSLVELFIRATIMYVVIVAMLRTVVRRQAGGIGTTDVLVLVLLAEVSGNGFAADYSSVVEGGVLVCTILLWSYVFEWAGYRYPAVERLLRASTLVLIENGRMLHRNMRSELITKEELMAQLREHGIEDIADVKRACMEADGMISVIAVES